MTCGLARLNVTVGEPGRGVAVSVLCLCFQGFEVLFIGIGPGDPVFKGLLVDSMAVLICEVDLEIVDRSEKFHEISFISSILGMQSHHSDTLYLPTQGTPSCMKTPGS